MKKLIIGLLLVGLAACSPSPQQPLPTQAQLPNNDQPTPTTEREATNAPGDVPTAQPPGAPSIDITMTGAIVGEFDSALLSFEVGSNYTLLLEQSDADNPVQLRLILAGNIEPGTYDIVPDQDFGIPEGQTVAARFDLGFLPESISGTLTLDSIGENSTTGSLQLTAQSADETITVAGEFQALDVVVIN
ncbi:MAG: hypothetical protein CL610_03985 [Anaerolineaceae bacterium]|nr:hypothetical protein [Anaerolineaceae bacterium]